jgi:pilus assembly protein Flp/PilA
MFERLKSLFRDEEGPTAVEYAIMVGGIAVVIIGAVLFFGHTVSSSIDTAAQKLENGP